jgi:tetratricopeptide (TPR) repeat protein
MTQPTKTAHPELDALFERYRQAPKSHIFAPLADACRKAGMIDEALDLCRKGVAANPGYASGYVVQGKCLYDSGRGEDAEAAFRRVLELDGHNLVALKFIGIIHAERGDPGAARACFEHILALDPDDKDIRRRLEAVEENSVPVRSTIAAPVVTDEDLVADMDDDDAIELPEIEEDFEGPTITLGGDAAETDDDIATTTLADIYASQGYREKALRIYREVARRQPGNEDVRHKIATLEGGDVIEPVATETPTVELVSPPTPEPEATPIAAAPERTPVASPAETPAPRAEADSRTSRIDETRSYEQFKRWLRSVSD